MFNIPSSLKSDFVIRCKGCGENIPAPVQTMPDTWIAKHCPLCGAYRRYLPNELCKGRLSHKLTRYSPSEPSGIPVQIKFRLQQNKCHVQCNADDCRTPISPDMYMKDSETLFRLLQYLGATNMEMARVKESMRKWGEGSIRITLSPGRKNLMRIGAPWNEGLLD